MADCPGPEKKFKNPRHICAVGCRRIVYEYWWADPNAEERKDPNEICTRRNGKIFQRGKGPHPPAHPNCGCKRKFAYLVCVSSEVK